MNLKLKFVIILVLVGLCGWEIRSKDRLKPGIDLAGGTSMLYQIDTTGLDDSQKREVAQNMIRILQQRIDPGSKKNLIWRAHGTDRIEIQMPLPKKETQARREAFQAKLAVIDEHNLDMRQVRRGLVRPATKSVQEYQAYRDEQFGKLAGSSDVRQELLSELAATNDQLLGAEDMRTAAAEAERLAKKKLEDLKINVTAAARLAGQWSELDDPNKAARLKSLASEDDNKQQLLRKYIDARNELAESRTLLTGPEGLTARRDNLLRELEQSNLDIDKLKKILESPSAFSRQKEISELQSQFPTLKMALDELVVSYDNYSKVAGRLDDPEDLKRQLRGSGVLEFRILPTPRGESLSEAEIKNYIDRLQQYGPNPARSGDDRYIWCQIRNPESFKAEAIRSEFAGLEYVLASNQPDEMMLHDASADGWKLKSARYGSDSIGNPSVDFQFNQIGAGRFLNLTKNNLQRPLCILLDGQAFSAPNIRSAISQSGQITGDFTMQEVQDLIDKLNAGSLPARLGDEPLSTNTVGPTIGKENLEAGRKAGVWGLVCVAVFMLLYYRFAGTLANLALFMNLLIILGVMAFSRATFTMPGIAGIILTIGMAVDANVLIFERIYEEQKRGSSLRIALKNGYDRAFRTILDANVTTFITALILYMRASEEVKGFALTLMIGIISSMFTALFVTHAVFDLLIEKRWLKNKLSMSHVIGEPKINWIGMKPVLWAMSAVLVIGGWFVFMGRDEATNSKYSIEFTGGTSIYVKVTDDSTRDDIEELIQAEGAKMGNDLIQAARVQQIGAAENREFEIVTTETNRVNVKLTLPEGKIMTRDELQVKILAQAAKMGDRRLEQTVVTGTEVPNQFDLETRQNNNNRVAEALVAIGGAEIEYQIETNDVVNQAVRSALEGKLDAQNNLAPQNVKAIPITSELISNKPYLHDYKGGLYLTSDFGADNTETMERLKNRFNQLQFSAEFEKYGTDDYKLFAPDGKEPAAAAALNKIEVAVISDDIRYEDEDLEAWNTFRETKQEWFTNGLQRSTSLDRVSQIDPSVGQKSMNDAMVAIVLSLAAIIIYIWVRFGNVWFSLAAVAALVHDVSIALGMVAASAWLSTTSIGQALGISDFKIDLPMIAAFLTVIGYSLNDTIVVFDRIRETRGKLATLSKDIINVSINQTLSRTLLTSVTTFIVLLVMYIWGGSGLRGFNYVMIIGVIVGTYSSIGIASLVVYGTRVGKAGAVEQKS